jgi:hypothetical protein
VCKVWALDKDEAGVSGVVFCAQKDFSRASECFAFGGGECAKHQIPTVLGSAMWFNNTITSSPLVFDGTLSRFISLSIFYSRLLHAEHTLNLLL